MKKRAAAAEFIRKSPEKVYAHVKSRIAGNMKAQKKAKKTGKAIQRNINDQTAFKKAQKAGIDIRDIDIRPYSASPSKLSRRGNNEKFQVSPERQGMIREQEEKLENMQAGRPHSGQMWQIG